MQVLQSDLLDVMIIERLRARTLKDDNSEEISP